MNLATELNNDKRIFGLDLLRAMAIVMVVLSHCFWIFPVQIGIISQLSSLLGFFGVEVFFVLSGFLIGRILYRIFVESDFNISSVGHFLKRRWFRTLPNYFLILLVNFVIAFLLDYRVDNGWKYFFFLQNFSSTMPTFFPESWSLSVEEFAYIILPMVLFLSTFYLKRNHRNWVFPIVTLLLIFICIVLKMHYQSTTKNTTLIQWNVSLKAVVIYRMDAIFIGVLCSWIAIVFANFWRKFKILFAVLGLLCLCFFTAGVGFFGLLIDKYPVFWNVCYLPAVSISIAFFLPLLSEWKTTNINIKRPIVFISLISYSIYLLHYSVILQTMKAILKPQDLVEYCAFTIGYLALTILIGYVLYRFFEKPLTNKGGKSSTQR